MSTVERDGDRSIGQQFLKADNTSRLIGQMKGWHRLADLWSSFTSATLLKPRHQAIHSMLAKFPNIVGNQMFHATGQLEMLVL